MPSGIHDNSGTPPESTPRFLPPETPGDSGPQPVLAGADDRYQAALVEMAAQQNWMAEVLMQAAGPSRGLHPWTDILDGLAQGVRISDAR